MHDWNKEREREKGFFLYLTETEKNDKMYDKMDFSTFAYIFVFVKSAIRHAVHGKNLKKNNEKKCKKFYVTADIGPFFVLVHDLNTKFLEYFYCVENITTK